MVIHDFALALRANGDTLKGFGQILVSDFFVAFAGGGDGGFVCDISEVGAGATSGFCGESVEIDVLRDRFVLEVNV